MKRVSKTKTTSNVAKRTSKRKISDKPIKRVTTDKLVRYPEKELVEFQKIIIAKLDHAKKHHLLLKETLCHTDSNDTSDTTHASKITVDGSDMETREVTTHLASRQEKLIRDLQNALVRIEHKTYGICIITGKLIPKARLLSVPHATISIDTKLK